MKLTQTAELLHQGQVGDPDMDGLGHSLIVGEQFDDNIKCCLVKDLEDISRSWNGETEFL